MEAIVLCCRMTHRGIGPDHPRGYLERARPLTQRAHALGATLTGWSAATLSFAWDTASTEEAIQFALSLKEDTDAAGDAWACAIAQGEMELLTPSVARAPGAAGAGAKDRESSAPPPLARGSDLAWGPALVAAVALARIAKPGEVLLDESLEALRAGELLKQGGRSGTDGGRTIRGARLDARLPWKAEAAAKIASIVDPPLLGRTELVEAIVGCPGTASVVRAARGLGGSRVLAEIAARASPSPHLSIAPSGLGVEPLGALRRAFAQSPDLRIPAGFGPVAARLLAGEGASVDAASSLVQAVLATAASDGPAALLIDDAAEVDGVTLEVCARALARSERPLLLVVRLDAADPLHPALAALPLALEVELGPLDITLGERLAESCTGGALTKEACQRWARRGGFSPLGIVEAIACSLATGEIAWVGESATPRRRLKGKGKARPASAWILRRAEDLSAEARAVLCALALLGGDASRATLDRFLAGVGAKLDTRVVVPKLVAARWVRQSGSADAQPKEVAGRLELWTRTHREAVRELIAEGRLRAWHRAAAQTLADTGPLGRAEAAYHAADAGDGPWAAKLAREAATAAAESRLEGSALRLRAFARSCDPAEGEEEEESPLPVSIPLSQPVDSEPPTIMSTGAAGAPSSDLEPPATVGSLRAGPASDRELPGSEPPEVGVLPERRLEQRMAAIAELSQGQVAHAIHVLRAAHTRLERAAASQSSLCQASLVLGVALAQAGQNEEALLQGLDALARAREGCDSPGEHACVTFLANLFEATSHDKEAARLRAKATTVGDA